MLTSLRNLLVRHPRLRAFAAPALTARQFLRDRHRKPRELAYDWLRSNLAGDPVVRIPCYKGVFALDVRSDVFSRFFMTGDYESELAAICASHAAALHDCDVLDVGANVGFYTVLLAKTISPGRRVLAVEPTPNAGARLKTNVLANGLGDRVVMFAGAASSHSGHAVIQTVEGREEYSSLGGISHPSVNGFATRNLTVETETIDVLVKRFDLKPGFIKVDVEGAEQMVFSGARRTLETFRPIVLSELNDSLLRAKGSSAAEVVSLFESSGYVVTDPLEPKLKPGARPFGDMLCLPATRNLP